jgi:hypothetical protein
MPVRLSVTLRDTKPLQKDLEDIAANVGPAAGLASIRERLETARAKLAAQPGGVTPSPFYEPNGPNPWVSEKQRRYVMMAIRRGIIKVPYERSGKYAGGWQVREVALKSGRGYQLYNPRKYAKWVGGSAYGTDQARIHQKRWASLRDTTEEALAGLPKEIADDIVMVARRRGYQAQ